MIVRKISKQLFNFEVVSLESHFRQEEVQNIFSNRCLTNEFVHPFKRIASKWSNNVESSSQPPCKIWRRYNQKTCCSTGAITKKLKATVLVFFWKRNAEIYFQFWVRALSKLDHNSAIARSVKDTHCYVHRKSEFFNRYLETIQKQNNFDIQTVLTLQCGH